MVAAVLIASHASGHAHDLWIEPTAFHTEVGRSIGLRLRVGEHFVGDSLPRDPTLANEFVVVDAAGRKPIGGQAGDDPAGSLRVAMPGVLVIGYRSNASTAELPAEKFNQYLREEGLEAVAALRASRNETAAAARESFYRCAKSLLLSGTPSENQGDRLLGFTLELLAERNLYALRAGQQLPLRLLYLNRPLAGALVVAMNRANPAQKLAARTDNEGRVRFQLQPDGVWLIKAVHMVRASVMSKTEWTSYWASLTFDTRAGNATNATNARRN